LSVHMTRRCISQANLVNDTSLAGMYIVTKVVFVSREAPYDSDGEFDFGNSDPACRLGS
jgi:hypothetical protein